MSEAEFDAVAATYRAQHEASIRASGEEPEFFAEYKASDVRRLSDRLELDVRSILDFGSGIGNSIAPLSSQFPEAQLTCLDVSGESLALARSEHGDKPIYRSYDGSHIPEDLGLFDIVFTACVFHHVPKKMQIPLLSQIRMLLRPGGRFFLFEHNPWNPFTVHAVNTCPFDANAELISAPEMRGRLLAAGFDHCDTYFRLFFPARLARLRPLERLMTRLPFGAQYCLSAR